MNSYSDRANLLKLMAHPMRLQILDLLQAGDECVCHLSAALDRPQPYVSQQLAILRNANVIDDYKEGTNVYYRVVDRRAALVTTALGARPEDRVERQAVDGCPCPRCRAGADAAGDR